MPKSCKDILNRGESHGDGVYTIDPDGKGQIKPFKVYCDMTNGGYTFYYVSNGKRTYKVSDPNSCQDKGLMLFAPRSKKEYYAGINYLKNVLKLNLQGYSKAGPFGIYHPTHNQDSYCDGCWTSYKPMNSYKDGASTDASDLGWKSINGGDFWISNKTNFAEPNGDYYKTCWLGIGLDSNGDVVGYNDAHCDCSYNSYLCTAKEK